MGNLVQKQWFEQCFCKPVEFHSQLHTHGQAVTQGQDGGEEFRHGIEAFVELLNGAGGLLFGIRLGNTPVPQDIICNEQATAAQARTHQIQHSRIVFFINIVKDDVELLLLL